MLIHYNPTRLMLVVYVIGLGGIQFANQSVFSPGKGGILLATNKSFQKMDTYWLTNQAFPGWRISLANQSGFSRQGRDPHWIN